MRAQGEIYKDELEKIGKYEQWLTRLDLLTKNLSNEIQEYLNVIMETHKTEVVETQDDTDSWNKGGQPDYLNGEELDVVDPNQVKVQMSEELTPDENVIDTVRQ